MVEPPEPDRDLSAGGQGMFTDDALLLAGITIVFAGGSLLVRDTNLSWMAGVLFGLFLASGLALGIHSPALAVLVAFVSVPFGGIEVPWSARTPKLFFAHILIAGAMMGSAWVFVASRPRQHSAPQSDEAGAPATMANWCVALYLVLLAVGLLSAIDVLRSGYLYLNRVVVLGGFLVALSRLRTSRARDVLLVSSAVVGLLISVTYFWTVIGTYGPTGLEDLGEALARKDNLARAGFLGVTNTIASLFAFTIPLTSGLLSWKRRTSVRRLGIASLVVQVAMLVTTASRGGILSLAFGLAGALALGTAGRKFLKQTLYGIVVVVVAYFVLSVTIPSALAVRYQVYFDPSVMLEYASRRTGLLLASWRAFTQHPVWGIGIGNVGMYDLISGSGDGSETHNLVLQTLAEEGLPALCLMSVLVLWMAWRLIKICRRDPSWVQTGVLWCLLATMADSMVEPTFWAPQLAFLFWPAMGVLLGGPVLARTSA